MRRKDFIMNSVLTTGVFLLPNAIWSLTRNNELPTNDNSKFVSTHNLNRFKISNTGTKFFETELSILKSGSKQRLNRHYFISESIAGYGTPALLEKQKETFVFIPELYQDKRHNGFIVKMCADGLCEETKIFTHENQGFYAFWGKEYLGQPTLYHYNFQTLHLMRAHRENDHWINHRVMPMYPNEVKALYTRQLKQVSEGQLKQQFGYDFEIHKDGFYQFLELKHGWEQGIITSEKETYEMANPAKVYSDLSRVPSSGSVNTTAFDYTNPFVPIYCKGDDLSHATIKPTVIYEEVAGSRIEIPDMPAYKTQDELGECKAFALAAILQWYTCQTWRSEIPDCKNPPPNRAISYFGLLAYTNRSITESKSFQPNQEDGRSMYEIINELSESGNRLILENCKPFDNLLTKFSLAEDGRKKRSEFFNFLASSFNAQKSKAGIVGDNHAELIKTIDGYVDLNISETALNNAFARKTFNQFLYTLFFSECEFKGFPSGFWATAYPFDSMNVAFVDVKNQILKGLMQGKPVLFGLCISQNVESECQLGHMLVISGFKKVLSGSIVKDVFKVHNSWGKEWQNMMNDGWVDGNILVQNATKVKTTSDYRISSGSVIWLDP